MVFYILYYTLHHVRIYHISHQAISIIFCFFFKSHSGAFILDFGGVNLRQFTRITIQIRLGT